MSHTKGKMDYGNESAYVYNDNMHNRFQLHISKGCVCKLCRPSADSNELTAVIQRITALWNAADGMSNEEAIDYLKHGLEMVKLLTDILTMGMSRSFGWDISIKTLLAKLPKGE